ncbi:MAG: putative tail-component [Bacteriophage sp.]|nr:MAG: putative tail-component [Bacteriophage sp.]
MVEIDFSEVNANIENLVATLPDKFAKGMQDACLLVEESAVQKVPVDTGYLKGTITNKVVKNGSNIEGYVYSTAEYAPYVELGTYKMNAKPFLYPALTQNQSIIRQIFSEVLK